MKKIIAIVLVMGLMSVGLLAVMPNASAQIPSDRIELDPSIYTGGNTYIFGEVVEIKVAGSDLDSTFPYYDIVLKKAGDPFATYVKIIKDNLKLNETSETGTTTYAVETALSEKQEYEIWVYNSTYSVNRTWGSDIADSENFWVQEYDFEMETDKDAYIDGDAVTVYWSAKKWKDGSPAPDGDGKITITNPSGELIYTKQITASTGSFHYTLEGAADIGYYQVRGWFNDSATNPKHFGEDHSSFYVGYIAGSVSTDQTSYIPSGIVVVTASCWADDGDGIKEWWESYKPGATVDITVSKVTSDGDVPIAAYGVTGLKTDSTGFAHHIFQLDSDIADETKFNVSAKFTNPPNGLRESNTTCTFAVTSIPEVGVWVFDVEITTDKTTCYSGDTVTVTAEVTASAEIDISTITYIFRIEDRNYNLMQNEVIHTKTADTLTDTITYTVPNNYADNDAVKNDIRFEVEVKNGLGNTSWDSIWINVDYGYLTVDAPLEYEGGETITIYYELDSTIITNPSYFYKVYTIDWWGITVVDEGVTSGGSFTFDIPENPEDEYWFDVYAIEAGKEVMGTDSSRLISGFLLGFTFDKTSYRPGDTVIIHYTITLRGDQEPQPRYRLEFGAYGLPMDEKVVSSATGDLEYAIPSDASYGSYLFLVTKDHTAVSSQIITIEKAPNPLASPVGGIPVFSYILLALVIIALLLGLRGIPRVSRAAPFKPKAEEKLKEIEKEEEEAGVSQLSVPCKSCGAAIEITTSKRPIEIMCPSCGETQILK